MLVEFDTVLSAHLRSDRIQHIKADLSVFILIPIFTLQLYSFAKSNYLTHTTQFLTMKLILQLSLFLVLLLETSCTKQLENGGKNWALLIAGSNGFFNYRHQVSHIII